MLDKLLERINPNNIRKRPDLHPSEAMVDGEYLFDERGWFAMDNSLSFEGMDTLLGNQIHTDITNLYTDDKSDDFCRLLGNCRQSPVGLYKALAIELFSRAQSDGHHKAYLHNVAKNYVVENSATLMGEDRENKKINLSWEEFLSVADAIGPIVLDTAIQQTNEYADQTKNFTRFLDRITNGEKNKNQR